MKIFFIEDEDGKDCSENGKRRFIRLEGKAAYNYLSEHKGLHFYRTVSAEKGLDKDEKDKKGKLIRQERYSGAMSRSFYVGDSITQEDVKAKFENGVLKLEIPKKEPQKQLPEGKYIAIA